MEGKVAVITGSAKGIGKGYAEILLENKVKVCIADINADVGKKTTRELQTKYGEGNVIFQKCDVTSEKQIEESLKKAINSFGRLDIVVNNAGAVFESKFKEMININLMSTVQGTMLAIKYLGKDNGGKGGVVINTSSIAGLMPIDLIPHYTAIKHAIVGFTRAIGNNSSSLHGIRINAICPAFVDTDFIKFDPEDLKKGQLYGPDIDKRLKEATIACGGPLLSVRDVAERFLSLVMDETLSGQVMLITSKGSGVASKMPTDAESILKLYVSKQI